MHFSYKKLCSSTKWHPQHAANSYIVLSYVLVSFLHKQGRVEEWEDSSGFPYIK